MARPSQVVEPEAPCAVCGVVTLRRPVAYECSDCGIVVCQACLLTHARGFAPAFTSGVSCPGKGCSKHVYLINDLCQFKDDVVDLIVEHLLYAFAPALKQIESVLGTVYQSCLIDVQADPRIKVLIGAITLLEPELPDIHELDKHYQYLQATIRVGLWPGIREHLDTALSAMSLGPAADSGDQSESKSVFKCELTSYLDVFELTGSKPREYWQRVPCARCGTTGSQTVFFSRFVACSVCGTHERESGRLVTAEGSFKSAECAWKTMTAVQRHQVIDLFSDCLGRLRNYKFKSKHISMPLVLHQLFVLPGCSVNAPLPDIKFRLEKFAVQAVCAALIQGVDVHDAFTKKFSTCVREMVDWHVRSMALVGTLDDLVQGTYMLFAQVGHGHDVSECIARWGVVMDRVDRSMILGCPLIHWPHHPK